MNETLDTSMQRRQSQTGTSSRKAILRGIKNLDIVERMRKSQNNRPADERASKIVIQVRRRRKKVPHKPPFAIREQEAASTSIVASTLTQAVSVVFSLNRAQVFGICFAILITTSMAIDISNNVKKNSSDKKPDSDGEISEESRLKQQVIRNVCANTDIKSYNKPAIPFDNKRGKLVPKSCINDKTESLNHLELLTKFKSDKGDNSDLLKRRSIIDSKYAAWQDSFIDQFYDIRA